MNKRVAAALLSLICTGAWAQNPINCPNPLTLDLDQATKRNLSPPAANATDEEKQKAKQVARRIAAKELADEAENYLQSYAMALPKPPAGALAAGRDCREELRSVLRSAADPAIALAGGQPLFDATKRLAEVAGSVTETVDTIAVQALAAAGALRLAQEQRVDPTTARYDFYAGPSYSLTPDGSWRNGVEVLFRSNSDRLLEDRALLFKYLQLSSLFAYRTLGGDEEVNLEDEGGAQPPPDDFVSSFDAKSGTASVDLRLSGFFKNRGDDDASTLGFAALLGAESLPTDADESGLTTLKLRGGLGPIYRTSYGDGALGELFVGYIHDSRYKAQFTGEDEDSTDRVALSGIIQLPAFDKDESLRLAARIFASTPISGGNASELRLSILLAYDLRSVFSKL